MMMMNENSFIPGQICELLYRILTNASTKQITDFHRCASIRGKLTSSPTCPSQLAPEGQTSHTAPNSSIRKCDVLQTWILTACMCALMLLA